MNTSWGSKASHRRKRVVLRTKVRWEILGLRDPTQSSTSPSIEDIRRQISSAASSGLSSDTLSRSHQTDMRPRPRPKTSADNRNRRAASQ